MTLEAIKRIYDTEPFHPFVIHLADGRKIPVIHREFMASAPNGRTVVVYQACHLDVEFYDKFYNPEALTPTQREDFARVVQPR